MRFHDIANIFERRFGLPTGKKLESKVRIELGNHFHGHRGAPKVKFQLCNNRASFEVDTSNAIGGSEIPAAVYDGLQGKESMQLAGYCRACRRDVTFLIDYLYGDGVSPNWRERLVCNRCNLNQRMRIAVDLFYARRRNKNSYITEQVTPIYTHLKKGINIIGSEYLGPAIAPGQNVNGIRHEDSTRLSFSENSFDALLSLDVLEHIPQHEKALTEFLRVLRPTGMLILTAPFDVNAINNFKRAEVSDSGELTYLAPPEYHGDPLGGKEGILCFWWFGWELLDQMRTAGFRYVTAFFAQSENAGYFGTQAPIIIGIK